MSDIKEARKALLKRILEGPGKASSSVRRSAFNSCGLAGPLATFVDKVVRHPSRVAAADITAVKSSGISEDQIFEITVCAAIGQANRQYESALAVLEAAIGKE